MIIGYNSIENPNTYTCTNLYHCTRRKEHILYSSSFTTWHQYGFSNPITYM